MKNKKTESCIICGDPDGPGECTPSANCLNVRAETQEKTVKPTAYFRWLMRESHGDVKVIESLIMLDLRRQNEQTFELMKLTGYDKFTPETYSLAASIVRNSCIKHKTH